jgi:hypothetical protein
MVNLTKCQIIGLSISLFIILIVIFILDSKFINDLPESTLKSIIINGIDNLNTANFYFDTKETNINFIGVSGNVSLDLSGIILKEILVNNKPKEDCIKIGFDWIRCDIRNLKEDNLTIIGEPTSLNGLFLISSQGKKVKNWYTRIDLGKDYSCSENCYEDKSSFSRNKLYYEPESNFISISPEIVTNENIIYLFFQINTYLRKIRAVKEFLKAIYPSLLFFIFTILLELKCIAKKISNKKLSCMVIINLFLIIFILYLIYTLI